MLGQRSTESREQTVGFQSTEARLRLQHAGRCPSQSHRGIAPALHVSFHAADGALHILIAGNLSLDGSINFIDVSVTNAVPEPSTWAMIILGFAGSGAMTYRRSRKEGSALAAV
jgi:hypothetical protein